MTAVRRQLPALLLAVLVAVAGTACSLPHPRSGDAVSKPAASPGQVAALLETYNRARERGDASLDVSILRRVESGSLLDIDAGGYFVSARVTPTEPLPAVRLTGPRITITPTFSSYPLWVAALVDDRQAGTRRLTVFERTSSTDPWLLTSAPELSGGSGLPAVAADEEGAAEVVAADQGEGLALSPTETLTSYARALSSPDAVEAELFADDPFRDSTLRFQAAQRELEFADFSQSWRAQEVRYAVRLEDGGALVVGDLSRIDAYLPRQDSFIDWRDNAAARAYLPRRVFSSAALTFTHQVLFVVPPDGQARLLGQYGGVVGGQGS